MNNGELHIRLDELLDKAGAPWFTTAEKDAFLNLAALEFVKQSYRLFETDEKKKQDIATLVRATGVDMTWGSSATVGISNFIVLNRLPKFMFILNMFGIFYDECNGATITVRNPYHDADTDETAGEGIDGNGERYMISGGTHFNEDDTHPLKINSQNPGLSYTSSNGLQAEDKTYSDSYIKSSIRPVQLDDIHSVENDPFNKPTDNYPLYVVRGDIWSHGYLEIFSDTNPKAVWIDYLQKPHIVDTVTNGTSVTDLNLPEHTHDEVVNIAVRKMLENVEDFEKYQAQQIEIQEQNQ